MGEVLSGRVVLVVLAGLILYLYKEVGNLKAKASTLETETKNRVTHDHLASAMADLKREIGKERELILKSSQSVSTRIDTLMTFFMNK